MPRFGDPEVFEDIVDYPPSPFAMKATERQNALEECATICRDIMREEDVGARADTPEECRNIVRHALRQMRYGTAKQILERIVALPSP